MWGLVMRDIRKLFWSRGLEANVELLRGLGLVPLWRRIHKGAFQKMAEVPLGFGGGEIMCTISQDLGW